MRLWTLGVWTALTLAQAAALGQESDIQTQVVTYRDGDQVLEGFLAWDAKLSPETPRPGVMVVHAWKGQDDHARQTAIELARRGYVGFACDIYGQGIRPANAQEARTEATKYRQDRPLLRRRAQVGLDFLKGQALVDPNRLAALGYCFGGGTVLELARSGASVAGVVSFHGNLDTPKPEDAQAIQAKVLVLHGADDPHVPDSMVQAFVKEMRDAKVDWQLVSYGGAVHSFTDKNAGADPSKGSAYHAVVADRAYQATWAFLREIFGED